MQWRGFQSLRGQEIPRVLSNDLTELERWLKQLSDRLATLISEEPVSGGGATSSAAAKVNEPYVVASASGDLTQERVLTQGTGITVTDSGPNSTITVAIDSTVITGAGVATRGTFWTGTNTIGSDAAFYWDNTAKQLQIVTTVGEQLKLGYDADDYAELGVTSAGMLTIDATPSTGQGKVKIVNDLLGINVTPADAWIEVQNQGSDPAQDVFDLDPWGWWSADYPTENGEEDWPDDGASLQGTTWYDRAPGHANTLTWNSGSGSGAITFTTTAIDDVTNGLPAIRLEGNGRATLSTVSPWFNDYTVFVVTMVNVSNVNGPRFGVIGFNGENITTVNFPVHSNASHPNTSCWAVDYPHQDFFANHDFDIIPGNCAGFNATAIFQSFDPTIPHVHALKRVVAANTVYRDGSSIVTDSLACNSGEALDEQVRFSFVGNKSGDSTTASWYALELIWFDYALNDSQRLIVETYLNNKYALNGGTTPPDTFDFDRRLNTSGDLLYRIDRTGQVLSSDIDYTTDLASRCTLIDAGGDMFDMGINVAGPYLSHWELTTLTDNRTVTIPNDGGTILLYTGTPANNDLVQYNGTTWVNKTLAGAGVASSGITLTAGAGLTGGGDLTANRTFDVGAGTGITVNANDVQISAIAAESFFANNTASSAVPVAVAGSTVAGAGLTYTTGGILAVGAGTAITVNANDVQVTTGNLTKLHALGDTGEPGFLKNVAGTLTWSAASTLVALDDLTDVVITAAVTGDVLRYNGTNWVNYPDSNYAASSVQVIAGDGLTGTGALTGNVTLNVGAGTAITVAADAVSVTTGNLTTLHALGHDPGVLRNDGAGVLTWDNTLYALQSRNLIAGDGLTGGGDLSADRTFNVVAGTGITVNANDIQVAAGNLLDLHNLADADGLLKNASGTLSWDTTAYVPQTRTITAGAGLTGTGNLSANLTLNVGAGAGIAVGINDVSIDASANIGWTGTQTFFGVFGWYDGFAADYHEVTTGDISDPAAYWTLTTLGDTTINCNDGNILWEIDGAEVFRIKDAEVSVATGTHWSLATSGAGTKWGTSTMQLQGWWNATPVVQSTGWTTSNVTSDKVLNANSTSIDELADVLGTLIDTLKTYGLLGA